MARERLSGLKCALSTGKSSPFCFQLATLWVLPPQSQGWHPWLQTGKEGVRGQEFGWRKATDAQAAQDREETLWAPPVSPGLWALPLPVWALCCFLHGSRGWQMHGDIHLGGETWAFSASTGGDWTLHLSLTFCIRNAPVAPCLCCVCLGQWRGMRFCPLLFFFWCWYWTRFLMVKKIWNGYFGLLMRKGAEWPKQVAQNCLALEETEEFR